MYDPIKEQNKEKYLNKAALKCRYDMISINKYNEKKGIETGSHWTISNPYPLLDRDLLEFKGRLENKTMEELGKRSQKVIQTILGNQLPKKLDTFNHTKEIGKVIKHLNPKIYNPKMDRSTTCFRSFFFKKKKNEKKCAQENNSLNSNSKRIIQGFSLKRDYKLKFPKKTIYDIKPFNMVCKKRSSIFLPNLDSKDNNAGNTLTSKDNNIYFQTYETDYTNVKNNKTIPNTVSNEEDSYPNLLETREILANISPLNKGKFKAPKISLKKPNKKNSSFNLKLLLNESDEEDNNIKNSKKEKKTLLNKKLFEVILSVKEVGKKSNDKIDNNNKEKKENKNDLTQEFPKRFYSMNYKFSRNKKDICISNKKMMKLEAQINHKFNKMRNYIQNNLKIECEQKDL